MQLDETFDLDLDLRRRRVPAWAWLVLVLAMAALWGVTMENGTVLKASAHTVHELFHDGRHFLGVPCH